MNLTISNKFALTFFLLGCFLYFCPCSFAQSPNEIHPEEFQDDPWVAEVPCRGNKEREGRAYIGVREFRLCFKFDEQLLQPTSGSTQSYSDLYIVSYTNRAGSNLTDIVLSSVHPEDHPGLIIGATATPQGPERLTKSGDSLSSKREFKVRIAITNQARSDKYPIALALASGTEATKEKVDFELPVLAPNAALIELDKKPQTSVDCWTGSDCSALELELRNKLPYKATITNISVSSDDLLQDKPVDNYSKDIGVSSSPHDLKLTMQAKPITFRRVFSGFGRPQVMVRIDYKDQYGRPLSSETTADLQIRPNIPVMAIFLILGAVIGTIVRIDLKKLQRAGVITGRQRAVFAGSTFATGILVCLIALFANIKLIIWNDDNSYSAWDPKVLFLTALVATVSGLPILYAYLKIPRQAETSPATQVPAPPSASISQPVIPAGPSA